MWIKEERRGREMRRKSNIFWMIAYGYILLPFLIFILGWIKWYFALPATVVLCYCFYKACKESPEIWTPEYTRENIVKIIFIISIIAIWVYYSGIGKFVFQNADHAVRNGIFNILVEHRWPVVNYEILPDNDLKVEGVKATGLIYYIGFWLPSALIGKIVGLRGGYYAQAVWAVLGIILVYYLICMILKKITVWPLFILIFFSGLDIVGIFLTGANPTEFESRMHLEWWGIPYQYSSMTTQLFWVFNQSIPAWVCTILVYVQKNNKNLIFILACSMLSSAFPFIGLLLLVTFLCLSRKYREGDMSQDKYGKFKNYIHHLILDTCTFQNVVGGGIVGIITYLYLKNNSSSAVIMGENIKGPEFENSLAKMIIFLIIEIGIYGALIYKYNNNNKLFYFVILYLCIIPPVKVGYSNDFCMRASIPALFVLMILVIKSVADAWEKKDLRVFTSLIVVLLIGSATPICEFQRTFLETFQRIKDDVIVYEEDSESVKLLNSCNFAGDIEENTFFKYLAK